MIVAQAEIDGIVSAHHRRVLRVPAPRTSRAPAKRGQVVKLQTRLFAKAQATITIADVHREPLAALGPADAKREGFYGIAGALEAWEAAHGKPERDQMVWVVSFLLGDHSELFDVDRGVYLAKVGGDYTTDSSRQAVPGDPPVTILEGAGEQARVMALAHRQRPGRETAERLLSGAGALRETMLSMRARNRAKTIENELRKLLGELPVCEVVHSTQQEPGSPADDAPV